uniref:Uncharacterized protein n=1 Tax=Tanacetum cinerariifolium TaxID=118510 RepID=A0A699HD52_TANCI|nr:hypothetical protein [Tanacetum cinerariifolium]
MASLPLFTIIYASMAKKSQATIHDGSSSLSISAAESNSIRNKIVAYNDSPKTLVRVRIVMVWICFTAKNSGYFDVHPTI